MTPKIDDQGYKDGGAAFRKGEMLRSLMDKMVAEMHQQMDQDKMKERENYHMSSFLGFADALIERLRSR